MEKTEASKKLKNQLVGPIVAMTTPFNKDYSVDHEGLKTLTDYYAEQGIKNVIVAGSTGEFFSMTDDERKSVIQTVVEQNAGRMTVIGCAAHSGTQLTVELAQFCEQVGCDGVMVTPPYYSFSGFEGLMKHYQMVSDAISIGIVLYYSGSVLRFPEVSGMVREDWKCPQKMVDLLSIPNIGAFKDASGNYGFHRDVIEAVDGPNGIVAVMGSNGMSYHLWGHQFGSRCYLTGLGNVWPDVEVNFFNKLDSGDFQGALAIVRDIESDYLAATKATGKYWSCLKYMLCEIGLPGGVMRPPLLDLNETDKKNIMAMCKRTGLIT